MLTWRIDGITEDYHLHKCATTESIFLVFEYTVKAKMPFTIGEKLIIFDTKDIYLKLFKGSKGGTIVRGGSR